MPKNGKKSGITITQDNLQKLSDGTTRLIQRTLFLGIPEDRGPRDGDAHSAGVDAVRVALGGSSQLITNAELGYIHEFGAPEANIPPRPFLEPGIRQSKEKIVARMEKAGKAAMDGDWRKVDQQYQSCGIEVVDVIVTRMEEGLSPALSENTRRARDKGASKENLDARKPLIDTGALRNSITWVERVKGEKVAEGDKKD